MAGCLSAVAAVGLHLASWHAYPGVNNFNPGGLVRADCEILWAQPQIGTFYNSESNVSFYGALEWEYDRDAFLTPFLTLGAATGYKVYPVVPLVSGGLRALFDIPFIGDVGVGVGVTPPFGEYGTFVVHAVVDLRF